MGESLTVRLNELCSALEKKTTEFSLQHEGKDVGTITISHLFKPTPPPPPPPKPRDLVNPLGNAMAAKLAAAKKAIPPPAPPKPEPVPVPVVVPPKAPEIIQQPQVILPEIKPTP